MNEHSRTGAPACSPGRCASADSRDGDGVDHDSVLRAYRRYAGIYDASFGARLNPGRRRILEQMHCVAGERVLEDLRKRLRAVPGIAVLNDVVLNQVLVRFGDDDAATRDVIARVQEDGTCWLGGTTWHGQAAMRIAISNWSTTPADIERSAAAIISSFASRR